jgi:hypothetical protein
VGRAPGNAGSNNRKQRAKKRREVINPEEALGNLIADVGIILKRTPTETARTCSLPELLLILRRHDRREALAEFNATWSRYEAGRAKWCEETAKRMKNRLSDLDRKSVV